MRFLKNKILRAQKVLNPEDSEPTDHSPDSKQEEEINTKIEDSLQNLSSPREIPTRGRAKRKRSSEKALNPLKKRRIPSSTKNMAINYGKAISSFAISSLAFPYLEQIIVKEGVNLDDFIDYVNRRKSKIGGIGSFRSLMLITERDNPRVAAFKRIFKSIGEVFIKYFSVNWIIHGKVSHKLIYLKYRFKMLRRIQNPEKFTFVKQRELQRVN